MEQRDLAQSLAATIEYEVNVMKNEFTAVLKEEEEWWVGWIEGWVNYFEHKRVRFC